ncbi:unnamed protein product, partial [marine sediment metagenome]
GLNSPFDINFTNPCIIKNGDYALPTTAWQCNTSLNHDTTYYWFVGIPG